MGIHCASGTYREHSRVSCHSSLYHVFQIWVTLLTITLVCHSWNATYTPKHEREWSQPIKNVRKIVQIHTEWWYWHLVWLIHQWTCIPKTAVCIRQALTTFQLVTKTKKIPATCRTVTMSGSGLWATWRYGTLHQCVYMHHISCKWCQQNTRLQKPQNSNSATQLLIDWHAVVHNTAQVQHYTDSYMHRTHVYTCVSYWTYKCTSCTCTYTLSTNMRTCIQGLQPHRNMWRPNRPQILYVKFLPPHNTRMCCKHVRFHETSNAALTL